MEAKIGRQIPQRVGNPMRIVEQRSHEIGDAVADRLAPSCHARTQFPHQSLARVLRHVILELPRMSEQVRRGGQTRQDRKVGLVDRSEIRHRLSEPGIELQRVGVQRIGGRHEGAERDGMIWIAGDRRAGRQHGQRERRTHNADPHANGIIAIRDSTNRGSGPETPQPLPTRLARVPASLLVETGVNGAIIDPRHRPVKYWIDRDTTRHKIDT